MPFLSNMQQNSENHEIALKKLCIEIENLQRESEKIFSDLGISAEEFLSYTSNQDNFSESEWKELENKKEEWNENLNFLLNQTVEVKKTAKTREELAVHQHFLFVR